MIFTLGMNAVAQGLMVFHTGGFSPQDAVTPLMRELAAGQLIPGVANPILIWAIARGRDGVPADPHNARAHRSTPSATASARSSCRAWIPAGARLICFVISGACAAFGGVLLAGWSNRSSRRWAIPICCRTIAAVVLGGTHVLGGRGTYLGTVAGVHPDHAPAVDPVGDPAAVHAGRPRAQGAPGKHRQIVFGLVIVAMMLLYGRGTASR